MTNINTFQGDVFIPEYIKHTGDDNNLFGFSGTDTFKIATAGSDRFEINSAGNVTLGVNLVIPDYIYHDGDVDTYFGFNAADSFVVRTNGSDRINVNNAGNVTIGVNIYMPDNIYHSGDTDTFFGFNGNNSIGFVTGGTNRFTINDSGITLQNGGSSFSYFKHNPNAGAWSALGQNSTGFNVNGQVAYQRVGNFVTASFRRVQFFAGGNFYLRHTVPAEFRPSNSYGDIVSWQNRVITNGGFWGMSYFASSQYFFMVQTVNGGHFVAGNGTQFNCVPHSVSYFV